MICLLRFAHSPPFISLVFVGVIFAYPVCPCQVWSSKDFKPVKTLSGHESKITSLDVVAGQNAVICYDFQF